MVSAPKLVTEPWSPVRVSSRAVPGSVAVLFTTVEASSASQPSICDTAAGVTSAA